MTEKALILNNRKKGIYFKRNSFNFSIIRDFKRRINKQSMVGVSLMEETLTFF